MQTFKKDELVSTDSSAQIDALLKRADELQKSIQSRDVHHVISSLPQTGDELTINGLIWVVERVNSQAGWMRLRLKKPDFEKDGE